MKATKRIINIANQIAKNNERRIKLNAKLNAELEKLGIDYKSDDFAHIIEFLDCESDVQLFVKYLESDCGIQSFFDHLEYDL